MLDAVVLGFFGGVRVDKIAVKIGGCSGFAVFSFAVFSSSLWYDLICRYAIIFPIFENKTSYKFNMDH